MLTKIEIEFLILCLRNELNLVERTIAQLERQAREERIRPATPQKLPPAREESPLRCRDGWTRHRRRAC